MQTSTSAGTAGPASAGTRATTDPASPTGTGLAAGSATIALASNPAAAAGTAASRATGSPSRGRASAPLQTATRDAATRNAASPTAAEPGAASAASSGAAAAPVSFAQLAASAPATSPGIPTGATVHAGATAQAGVPTGQLPGVASQLVAVVAPMRSLLSGAQTVTIALHPADLGSVQATVVLHGEMLTVRLLAATPAGAAALHASLPELQRGLEADGQRSSVLLGDAGAFGGGGGASQHNPGPDTQQQPAPPAVATRPAATTSTPSHRVLGPPDSSSGSRHLLDVRA